MRRHTTRLRAGLLAFSVGAAVLSLSPARTEPAPSPTPTCTPPAVSWLAASAPISIADTAKDAGPRVSQQLWVKFPKAGLVQVRAVENYDERMRIEVLDGETDALLYTFQAPTDAQPNAEQEKFGTAFLRFRVLRDLGLPQPLILVVAVRPGGSGHGFYVSLIGEVGGRLKVLTRERLTTNNQGGIHVGDLGGGRGMGVAIWSPIWDPDCEAHYGAHQFEVEQNPLDVRRGRFVKGRTVRSRKKYGGHGEGALGELRLGYTDLLQDMPDVSEYHWL